jgi:hypothetical protein
MMNEEDKKGIEELRRLCNYRDARTPGDINERKFECNCERLKHVADNCYDAFGKKTVNIMIDTEEKKIIAGGQMPPEVCLVKEMYNTISRAIGPKMTKRIFGYYFEDYKCPLMQEQHKE